MDGLQLRLMGGLGNQLFQLGAARFVSEKLGRPVAIDASFFSALGRIHGRMQGLDARYLEISSLLDERTPISRKHSFRYLLNAVSRDKREQSFQSISKISCENPRGLPSNLFGYFQNIEAASHVVEDLRRMVPEDLIRRNQRSLAVHIRLGDFVRVDSGRRLVSSTYFESRISEALATGNFDKVVVYSDDIVHASESMRGFYFSAPVSFDIPEGAGSLPTLLGLSSHKARVLSASSFSWWASYIAGARFSDCFPPAFRANEDLFGAGPVSSDSSSGLQR